MSVGQPSVPGTGRFSLRWPLVGPMEIIHRLYTATVRAWVAASRWAFLVVGSGVSLGLYLAVPGIEDSARSLLLVGLPLVLLPVWAGLARVHSHLSHRPYVDSLKTGALSFTPLLLFAALAGLRQWDDALFMVVGPLLALWSLFAIGALRMTLEHYWLARAAAFVPRGKSMRLPGTLMVMVVAYAAALSYLSLQEYWSFRQWGLDLAIFTQLYWNTSGGHPMALSLLPEGNFMAVHFSPLLMAWEPLYALHPQPETLLVLQSIVLATGAVPVFALARRVLGGRVHGLVFAGIYLLYPPLTGLNLYAFHPEVAAIPLLLAALWALDGRRPRLALVALVLAMSTKEDIAPLGFSLGLYLLLHVRQRRAGAAFASVSLVWLILSIALIIPYFRGGEYLFFQDRYSNLGATPGEIAFNAVAHPDVFLAALFELRDFTYLFDLLVPVFFLPLANLIPGRRRGFGPNLLLVATPNLVLNMLSRHWPMAIIGFQYTIPLIPIVFAAAIYGAARLVGLGGNGTMPRHPPPAGGDVHRNPSQAAMAVSLAALLFALPVATFLSPLPPSLSYQLDNFRPGPAGEAAAELIKLIPPNASVTFSRWTQELQSAAAHLANRERIYLYPDDEKPDDWRQTDYLIIDTRFVDPGLAQLLERLLGSGEYLLLAEKSTLQLYARSQLVQASSSGSAAA